jgi:hypothetical protein
MIVSESLDRFMMLNEDFLAENILNEKISINSIRDKGKRIAVLASMFFIFVSGNRPELLKTLPDKTEIAKSPLIFKMAEDNYLEKDEIFRGFEELLHFYQAKPRILSASSPGFIEAVNKVIPYRLDSAKVYYYDRYDEDILKAADKLMKKGEEPNADLIKAIMLIETGMTPVKNELNYEGFPQTKQHIIDDVNNKNGTSFTMEDMYDAEKSAEFIHYYIKTISRSQHVNTLDDLVIAYNWGLGNLKKYKNGELVLPEQTEDYIAMLNIMQDFFAS